MCLALFAAAAFLRFTSKSGLFDRLFRTTPAAGRGVASDWQLVEMPSAADAQHFVQRLVEDPYMQIVFSGLLACVIIGIAFVFLLWVYDLFLHWRHRAYFRCCQKQVQSLSKVFERPNHEMPLCAICIEKLPSELSSRTETVVFLCGHRFHTECANSWHSSKLLSACMCPICDGCDNCESDNLVGKDYDVEANSTSSSDEARVFFIRSLSKRFPEFITQECVRRWSKCHTELWLSELRCPPYLSIFTLFKENGIFARKRERERVFPFGERPAQGTPSPQKKVTSARREDPLRN